MDISVIRSFKKASRQALLDVLDTFTCWGSGMQSKQHRCSHTVFLWKNVSRDACLGGGNWQRRQMPEVWLFRLDWCWAWSCGQLQSNQELVATTAWHLQQQSSLPISDWPSDLPRLSSAFNSWHETLKWQFLRGWSNSMPKLQEDLGKKIITQAHRTKQGLQSCLWS